MANRIGGQWSATLKLSFRAPTSQLWSLLRHDVGLAGDLLPAAALLHPYPRKGEMFGFAGVGHFSAPPRPLAAGHDHGVAIDTEILGKAWLSSINKIRNDVNAGCRVHAADLMTLAATVRLSRGGTPCASCGNGW